MCHINCGWLIVRQTTRSINNGSATGTDNDARQRQTNRSSSIVVAPKHPIFHGTHVRRASRNVRVIGIYFQSGPNHMGDGDSEKFSPRKKYSRRSMCTRARTFELRCIRKLQRSVEATLERAPYGKLAAMYIPC